MLFVFFLYESDVAEPCEPIVAFVACCCESQIIIMWFWLFLTLQCVCLTFQSWIDIAKILDSFLVICRWHGPFSMKGLRYVDLKIFALMTQICHHSKLYHHSKMSMMTQICHHSKSYHSKLYHHSKMQVMTQICHHHSKLYHSKCYHSKMQCDHHSNLWPLKIASLSNPSRV